MSQILDAKYYGNLWQTDGLNNQQIGGASGYVLSIRDRSRHTGSLTSVDLYQKDDTPGGYSGGNGGSMRLRVETDSAGGPSGSLISAGATVTQTMPIPATSSKRFTLGTPVSDVLGTLRHVVLNNTDASPTVNFVSINCINLDDLTPTPLQPTYLDADRACLRSTGGAFSLIRTHYPIIIFNYADGYSYGVPIYDALSNSGQREIGSGGRMVRLNFTPSETIPNVILASMRVAKRNSSTTQPFVLSLDDLTGGGTVLETTSIPAASVHIGNASADPTTPKGYGTRYVDLSMSPRTFANGRNYALRGSSAEITNYYFAFPSRQAAAGDFFSDPGDDAFIDGSWEYTTDGVNWNQHNPGFDAQIMQAFFTLADPPSVQTGRSIRRGGRAG